MVSFVAQKVFFSLTFDDVPLHTHTHAHIHTHSHTHTHTHTHTHILVTVPYVFDVISEKALPNPRSKRCTPMFQVLTFSSLNPF